MKILMIGSGGREHALTWSLARSSEVKRIYTASHNAGILQHAAQADLVPNDVPALADFATREGIDLTVAGPEQPLVDGVIDAFAARGLAAFGPTRAAARLEGSKVFAKEFMARHRIPTARYRLVETAEAAQAALRDGSFTYPLVVKADGLAAGKGVVVAEDEAQAWQAVNDLLVEKKLGAAGARLILEECLQGRELSYLVFTDGESYAAMPVAQDHKRVFDGDRGPNTGGMGAFSAPGLLDEATAQRIVREVVEPTLEAARAEGFPFRGVLYCGLMLTEAGPRVLEYNVRLGDPETQAILRRLDSDLLEILLAVTRGELHRVKPRWSDDAATCVVLASAGYPGSVATGKVIDGLEAAEQIAGVVVFHAGTKRADSGRIETAGGRVLGVTARAVTLTEATARAYQAAERIGFEGMHYRRDIGQPASGSALKA
jgi:phosphoribosylamine--glycine ligase